MTREPGFYWVRLKRFRSWLSEVALWDGATWHVFADAPAIDTEVVVLSERLTPPTHENGGVS